MNKIRLIGLLMLFCFVITSCAQTTHDNQQTKIEKIDEIVSLYTDYDGFNGTVLVSHNGSVIFKKGYGFANMEWNIPNQIDTKFRIASVTKPFTAILIMQLVAKGKIDLYAPISTYLADYPSYNANQITIHHLLTHTSGIPNNYESDKRLNQFPDRARLEDKVSEFSDLPLEFEPGERFNYSNAGYMVLSYIIETVTNKPYETVLKENILAPIEMNDTGVDKHRPILKNRASGYFKGFGDYFNIDYDDMSAIMGVGNIYSTVEDLFLLDQALNSEKLLSKENKGLLFSKQIRDEAYGGHYGYGWELIQKPIGNTRNTVETSGHSGSISGFTTLFTRIPSSNSTIIFMNNSGRAFLNSMTTAITGILYDKPYDFPLKPLAMFMTRTIEKKGINDGIQFYKNHKDKPEYYVNEQELIVAGYRYLHAGNPKFAAEIFKLSIQIFPNKDNPYDSYAESLMVLGQNKEAIINYNKSLELNPQNKNAKKMLKILQDKEALD